MFGQLKKGMHMQVISAVWLTTGRTGDIGDVIPATTPVP